MFQLFGLLFSLTSTTLAGTAVIVVLVAGADRLFPILAAAATGVVVAVPVAWFLAKKLYN